MRILEIEALTATTPGEKFTDETAALILQDRAGATDIKLRHEEK